MLSSGLERGSVRTLALRCAFDDTRQIQELDLGVVIVDDTRNARQRGELHSRAQMSTNELLRLACVTHTL